MPNSLSKYKERCIKDSIQQPFQRPLPPETKEYPYDKPSPRPGIRSFLWSLLTEFWTLFTVYLHFNAPNVFRKLRKQWQINEKEYRNSFQEIDTLSGPMGFSGASFFRTHNKKYLLKSLNRGFEYRYYYNDLLLPLAEYQLSHPSSYIVHITDCLFTSSPRLGHLLGTTPSHFLIMQNVQYTNSTNGDSLPEGSWEDYDLKPDEYFFPERDFMGGLLASEETKDKLHDTFEGTVPFTRRTYESIVRQLEEDSGFLCRMEVVDYSLFMIRRKYKKGIDFIASCCIPFYFPVSRFIPFSAPSSPCS
jgi:hypothetical protein